MLRPAALSTQYDNYSNLVLAVAAVLFVAYTYDIGEWHGQCWVVLRNVIFAMVAIACGTAAMMAFQGYPYMPLALVLTFVPLCAFSSSRSISALLRLCSSAHDCAELPVRRVHPVSGRHPDVCLAPKSSPAWAPCQGSRSYGSSCLTTSTLWTTSALSASST